MTNHGFSVLENIFPIHSYVKLWSFIVAQPYPQGLWFLTNLNYTTYGIFRINLTNHGLMFLTLSKKNIFKIFFLYTLVFLCLTLIVHCSPIPPKGSWSQQTRIFTTCECFHINMALLFLRRFFPIYSYVNPWLSIAASTYPVGIMIWTNLNLHHLQMPPYKYDQ